MSFSVASRVAFKAVTGRRVVARAEETSVAKVDRSGDSLFFPSDQSLGYLDGTYAGDFGFDPLGLSDPEGAGGFIDPDWLRYAEIINGRWAMLGAAGMVGPEALGNMGLIPEPTRVLWFKSGVFPPAGTPEGLYGMDPWALFWVEIALMNFTELRRWQDYKKPGSMGEQYLLGLEKFLGGSGEPAYPGGPVFNPMGMAREGESQKTMRTKEIKNGRLAMIACLAFASQAVVTGKGPVQNLTDHLSSPFSENLLANFGKMYGN